MLCLICVSSNQLLEEVCAMGKDPHFICQKPQPKPDPLSNVTSRRPITLDAASSDDDDEDDEVASTHSGTVGKHGESQAGQESAQYVSFIHYYCYYHSCVHKVILVQNSIFLWVSASSVKFVVGSSVRIYKI